MLEILLDSETKHKLTKIKRKSSLDDFRSFLVQEFAFTFDLTSLLRKHILKLPCRSLISKDKIMIFNCGKSCTGNKIFEIQSDFVKIYLCPPPVCETQHIFVRWKLQNSFYWRHTTLFPSETMWLSQSVFVWTKAV